MSRRILWVALLGAVMLAGCSLAPHYERPVVDVGPAWRDTVATPDTTIANIPWWEIFRDPELQALIDTALVGNRDLAIAVERIEEARARYGFAKADLWPQLNANAVGGGVRSSAGSLLHLPEGEDNETPIYALGADLSWELDFFGRARNASAAEKAMMLAADQGRRAVVLSLVAGVASTYADLRDLDRRLEISQRTLDSRREYVELAQIRFEGGVTPEGDYRQAESEYHRVRVIATEYEKLVAQKENELSVLLGHRPSRIERAGGTEPDTLITVVPAGLPSQLLDRRPDIRQAEEELIAANARIGEAKALLFPHISLTGSFGYASTDLDNFFVGANQSWNLLGNLLQPIFNAGKNRRRVDVTQSQQRQAVYAYESTVLRALREVDDALVAYRISGEQRASQRARVDAERKVLELAEARYRGGVAPYLEVLDAQRSLFTAEIDQTQTVRNHVVALVQVYKALGGGWPAVAEE